MSDPVTNVEIEDVLSSIRRLVSDGDKARTRDPAPADTAAVPEISPDTSAESMTVSATSDRLVLTPAFLVVDGSDDMPAETASLHAVPTAVEDDAEDDDWHEEAWQQKTVAEDDVEDDVDEMSEPLPLTNMVWDGVDKSKEPDAANDRTVVGLSASAEKVGLAATIAELEAAFSANDEEYEPDGSEVMDETIEWPGAAVRDRAPFEDAVISDEIISDEIAETAVSGDAEAEDAIPAFGHRNLGDIDVTPSVAAGIKAADPDEYGDDDLDGLPETGGVSLDEAAMRELVAEVVREELAGPLGERITRNVRKLVRREIYRILSSQEFD
jgi:hypothetical protein